ncbi:hypothetical protein FD19_GL000946 [Lacticaseibacillus thailandensis DSM 22698 = JCM 13996]|uniref:Uncharacterized protein n=1 Tax=Lacticaseibacillus thailandensis DSM 22698 = JCM 13996 TaxID=1423810 RepID=A0A0R2C8R4_9LACO|nr:hypothetical protein FD19_GL000946 [Lacticaseibacillus thailandensis DSM 22698 = JCM 13996]
MLVLIAFLGIVCWTHGQVVSAATDTGTLNINKRVAASGEGVSQQTVPLGGARYQVTRIVARSSVPINAQQPRTYRALAGRQAFSIVVTTDAEGMAQVDGLALNATYLVQELSGPGVVTPAGPVALVFNTTHLMYTYTPKSGLMVPTTPSEHRLPNTFEPVGNGGHLHKGAHILQTGGQYRTPGLLVLVMMLVLMGMPLLVRAVWHRMRTVND